VDVSGTARSPGKEGVIEWFKYRRILFSETGGKKGRFWFIKGPRERSSYRGIRIGGEEGSGNEADGPLNEREGRRGERGLDNTRILWEIVGEKVVFFQTNTFHVGGVWEKIASDLSVERSGNLLRWSIRSRTLS